MIYVVHAREQAAHHEERLSASRLLGNVSYQLWLSGERGRIQGAYIMSLARDIDTTTFMLCGPAPFLHALIDQLKQAGMLVSSFTPVSIHPPLLSVCIQKSSRTWPLMCQAGKIGLSLLGDHQAHVCRHLSSKADDRFAQFEWAHGDDGSVFIRGSIATIDCSIASAVEAGDHQVIILSAHAANYDQDFSPVIFHAYKYRSIDRVEPQP